MKTKLLFAFFMLACTPLFAQQKDSTDVNIFDKVEVEAQFPGGLPAWTAYLRKNLDANIPTDNDAPMGTYRVVVRFIVSKTGAISAIVPETKMGYGMEQEVIRIIQKSPNWVPAVQNGRPVNAYRRQPITFVVIDDDIDIEAPEKWSVGKATNISIKVNKFNSDDLQVKVDNGTIENKGNGNYKLVPAKKGKLIIAITGTKKGKTIDVGSAYYPVE